MFDSNAAMNHQQPGTPANARGPYTVLGAMQHTPEFATPFPKKKMGPEGKPPVSVLRTATISVNEVALDPVKAPKPGDPQSKNATVTANEATLGGAVKTQTLPGNNIMTLRPSSSVTMHKEHGVYVGPPVTMELDDASKAKAAELEGQKKSADPKAGGWNVRAFMKRAEKLGGCDAWLGPRYNHGFA